jgi:hypothetical protein
MLGAVGKLHAFRNDNLLAAANILVNTKLPVYLPVLSHGSLLLVRLSVLRGTVENKFVGRRVSGIAALLRPVT